MECIKHEKIINIVSNVLKDNLDLSIEILSSALILLKENPELSIEDAILIGANEWDVNL